MFKKLVSFVLCIAMVLSLSVCIFAEDEENDQVIKYVSFGASQTWGYGAAPYLPKQFSNWTGSASEIKAWNSTPDQYKYKLKTWNPEYYYDYCKISKTYSSLGVNTIVNESFPCLLSASMEDLGYDVELSQLAISGFDSLDLLGLLTNGETCDNIKNWLLQRPLSHVLDVEKLGEDTVLQMYRDKYQNAVKEANLITYDLGSVEISTGFEECFSVWASDQSSRIDPEYELILNENDYKQFEVIRNILETQIDKYLEYKGIALEDSYFIRNFVESSAYGIMKYCCCLDKNLERIYELNPDVCVVVVQVQNFYSGQEYSLNGVTIPVGDIVQIAVDFVNTYASSFSKYCDKYYYAKVTDNQRVEFNWDLIKNYAGPEDITDNLKYILDVMDNIFNIHVKSMYTSKFENIKSKYKGMIGGKNYNKGLNACYDSCLQLLSYVYNLTPSIDGVVEGDSSEMAVIIDDMIASVAALTIKGKDYQSAVDKAIESFDNLSEADKGAIITMYINMLGDTYINHPTADGQKEMAQGVAKALMMDNKGMKSILGGLKNSTASFAKNMSSIANCIEDIVDSLAQDPDSIISSLVPDEVKAHLDEVKTNAKSVKNNVDEVLNTISNNVKTVKSNVKTVVTDIMNKTVKLPTLSIFK